jgi:hypothetical protein
MSAEECVLIHGSVENTLNFLNECNCCNRHAIDRPKNNKKWYDRCDANVNLTKSQLRAHRDWRAYVKWCMPCGCKCRQLAREICRNFKKSEKERCPVREELLDKFRFIIENTNECSICLVAFNDDTVYTTLNLCGHTFCKKCITKWFNCGDCVECPLCRVTSWSETLHIGTWNNLCNVYI